MKVVPAAIYLSEFNDEAIINDTLAHSPDVIAESPAIEESSPPVDNTKTIFEAGVLEGKKQVEDEASAQLTMQKNAMTEQFNKEIAKLSGEFAEQLADQLKTELRLVKVAIENSLAAVIRPFVSEVLEIKILDELAVAIRDIFSDPRCSQITVRGPIALLNRLEESLTGTSASIVFIESDDPEICIEHDHDKIQSQFQGWLAVIRDELE